MREKRKKESKHYLHLFLCKKKKLFDLKNCVSLILFLLVFICECVLQDRKMLSEAIEKDRQQQCEQQQQQNRTKSGWNMHCKCCCRNRKKRNHRSQGLGVRRALLREQTPKNW